MIFSVDSAKFGLDSAFSALDSATRTQKAQNLHYFVILSVSEESKKILLDSANHRI